MRSLEGHRAMVTGGSRGLGRGVVDALVREGAHVTVVARTQSDLEALASDGVDTVCGDATDPTLAANVLERVRPTVLVLNAGCTPTMAPLHEQSWEAFCEPWNTDVKATFHWLQTALRLPLPSGSRVVLTSSGAAINGSPLSGGYAGAKHMIRLMAAYANAGHLRVQAVLPLQIIEATTLGRTAGAAYAKARGISVDAFFAGFGTAMSPADYGQHVASILCRPEYAHGTVFGVRGDRGVESLDA